SMQEQQRIKTAVDNVLMVLDSACQPGDQISLLPFNQTASECFSRVTKKDHADYISSSLQRLQAGGGTALWDALKMALDKMSSVISRRAQEQWIVCLTNGEDVSSRCQPAELVELARRIVADSRQSIHILAIGIGLKASAATLAQLCGLTPKGMYIPVAATAGA